MRIACLILLSLSMWASSADDARKVLTDAAHAKEGDLRKETAFALSLIPATDTAAALLDAMLADKDYMVRVAALDSLEELNDTARIPLLKGMLADEVPEVAFAAAKALWGMKVPEGREALQSVFEGEMKAKSNFFKKEMMNSWRRMKTPRSAFLFSVERGIGFVPVPGIGAGYSAMLGMLADAEFSARAVSLLLVCSENNKPCDEMLGTAFGDEDWTVRAAAVHLVATKNLTSMQSKLAELLEDKKDKVKLRAAAGYLRMEASRLSVPKLSPKKIAKKA